MCWEVEADGTGQQSCRSHDLQGASASEQLHHAGVRRVAEVRVELLELVADGLGDQVPLVTALRFGLREWVVVVVVTVGSGLRPGARKG